MAATTDLLTKVGLPGSATTLDSPGFTIGNTTINVGNTANWQTETKQVFAMDQVTIESGKEVRVAGSYRELEGIVTSATSIGSMSFASGFSPRNYPAGSTTRVYIPVSSTRENQLVDWGKQDHNLKGNHKTLTDDNGNEFLERGSVASAVNHVKVTNAITGNAARVDASGDDTNVDIYFGGKGSGVPHVENPELISNFVVPSTGAVAQVGGLVGNFANITYYISGKRYKASGIANKTYTASKDTYVDINTSGVVTYVEVANGATVGMALTANSVRVAKVVTNGSAITSISQFGTDPLNNAVFPNGPVNPSVIDTSGFSLNIKSAKTTSTNTPTNGVNTDLAGNGATISFTVSKPCSALVTTQVACNSSTDFEMKPLIYVNGVVQVVADWPAALSGGAGTRAVMRSLTVAIPLSTGANAISAGIFISSASGQSVPAGAAVIAAIVLGKVTA